MHIAYILSTMSSPSSSSSSLACSVIWGRRYNCLASSSVLPCLLWCSLSALPLLLFPARFSVIFLNACTTLLFYTNYNIDVSFLFIYFIEICHRYQWVRIQCTTYQTCPSPFLSERLPACSLPGLNVRVPVVHA